MTLIGLQPNVIYKCSSHGCAKMVRSSLLVSYLHKHHRHYHSALKPVAKTHKTTPTTSVAHTHQRPCGATNAAKSPTTAGGHQPNCQHHEREAMRDRQRLQRPADETPPTASISNDYQPDCQHHDRQRTTRTRYARTRLSRKNIHWEWGMHSMRQMATQ